MIGKIVSVVVICLYFSGTIFASGYVGLEYDTRAGGGVFLGCVVVGLIGFVGSALFAREG